MSAAHDRVRTGYASPKGESVDRSFDYTKDRLRWILERILENDIRDGERYSAPEHANEGFEKRAVLEFVLWFLEEAFPENFSFRCDFQDLEQDYPTDLARIIAAGESWSEEPEEEDEIIRRKVIHVDFQRGLDIDEDD